MPTNKYDTIDAQYAVTFYQAEPHRQVVGKNDTPAPYKSPDLTLNRKSIQNKWLYIFRSPGNVYAVAPGNGDFGGRTSYLYAHQSIAKWYAGVRNPARTTAPKEHAVEVKYEVYFDDYAYLYYRDISQEASMARHNREHPISVSSGATTTLMPLPLLDENQAPIRYYFLLSSKRLGPNALAAATQPGAADGLSIWPVIGYGSSSQVIGPTPEIIRNIRGTWTEYLVAAITVVDPYHFAGDINSNLLNHAQERYEELLNQIAEGKLAAGIPAGHTDNTSNRGNLFDLYYIATALEGVRKSVSFNWDEAAAKEVTDAVRNTVVRSQNACELAANFLTNWMSGPACSLLDVAITADTLDPTDPDASNDRAYGLIHWYNVSSMLGYTAVGSTFLANQNKVCVNNPAKQILMRYESTALPVGSLDEDALARAVTVVPDLVLQQIMVVLADGALPPDPSDTRGIYDTARVRRERVQKLINNLHLLPFQLEEYPSVTEGQKGTLEWQKIAPYVDNGTWLWESGIPNTMKFLLARHLEIDVSTLDEVLQHQDQKVVSVGGQLLKAYEKHQAGNWMIAPGKLLSAVINVAQSARTTAELASKDYVPGFKTGVAAAQTFMGVLGIYEAMMAIKGVEPTKLADMLSLVKPSGGKIPLVGATLGTQAGALLCFCGFLSAIWTVSSNTLIARDAWDTRDYSNLLGAASAIYGGYLLLLCYVGIFAAAGPVGWLAGALVIAGGVVIYLFADDDFVTFVGSSYFAASAGARNIRTFGGSDHWAGPVSPGYWRDSNGQNRNWAVSHQRFALQNLLSRFVAQASILKTFDSAAGWLEVREWTLTITQPLTGEAFYYEIRLQYDIWDPVDNSTAEDVVIYDPAMSPVVAPLQTGLFEWISAVETKEDGQQKITVMAGPCTLLRRCTRFSVNLIRVHENTGMRLELSFLIAWVVAVGDQRELRVQEYPDLQGPAKYFNISSLPPL